MSKFLPYRISAQTLIEAGDGVVSEGLFVNMPGVMVLATDDGLTDSARALFQRLNIFTGQSDTDLLAEFIARVTYLSFPFDQKMSREASGRLHTQLKTMGHTSPYEVAAVRPSVLVAGLAIETLFEFVANKYEIGRMTSSRTRAMNTPLYRIPSSDSPLSDAIRSYLHDSIRAYEAWRSKLPDQASKDVTESLNILHPGCKAGYMVVAGDPSFWNKKISRRLVDHDDGVEHELRSVLYRIADLLHGCDPSINAASFYG
ncbi:hypothetical protein KBD61_00725 [Patescibacteria group bacterium]|nr:hypothetical protein [Patescibacteria group bacterium]MBP9709531.1 hypothetical protein [Patescibacteria group bacterium]